MCLSAFAGLASAQAPITGIQYIQAPGLTIPRGGVWLPDNSGGHYWVSDSGLGFCRVDLIAGTSNLYTTTNCQGAVASAAQVVVADPASPAGLKAGSKYIFVADSSSKSNNVVRFTFDPAGSAQGGTIYQTNVFTITPDSQAKGGGATGGGRTVALALASNKKDLFVGYIRVGDIMLFPNATDASPNLTTTSKPFAIAGTSDGGGMNSLALYNNNLYVSEQGSLLLTNVVDPMGVNSGVRCNPNPGVTKPCTAIAINPSFSFPGGLTNGKDASGKEWLYIGYAPLTSPGSVKQWDGVNPMTDYSISVAPPYTSPFDGVTRNQYWSPMSIGVAPNGDLYVGDDPTAGLRLAVLPTGQGHLWRVPAPAVTNKVPSITAVVCAVNCGQPANGPIAGGTNLIVTGQNLFNGPSFTTITIGPYQATNVICQADGTSCTATTVPAAGPGTLDLTAHVPNWGPATMAGAFTYNVATQPGAPSIATLSTNIGVPNGGTLVTITGASLVSSITSATPGAPGVVTFGAVTSPAPVSCNAAGTQCVAVSPAGAVGTTVQVHVTVEGISSNGLPFTYTQPTASVRAFGITAPKGGMVWIPRQDSAGNNLGTGHWWSSDHANGFCRQDSVPGVGATLTALNVTVCDPGTIGSSGQAAFDPRPAPCTPGAVASPFCHYVYVPDNAVKSVTIWRLTINSTTETLAATAPEQMLPLADIRTLKPNGMALGPDGSLYVTDLTETNIRRIDAPNGDPRTQTVTIVAHTGDGRGANGTIGFLGVHDLNANTGDTAIAPLPPTPGGGPMQYQNILVVSENRAAAYFDVTAPCAKTAPVNVTSNPAACSTTPFALTAGVFVAGVATDPVRHYVYASDSPGAGAANIWRADANVDSTNPANGGVSIYLSSGTLPAAGTPNATPWTTLTGTRPWDLNWGPQGGPGGFAFVFGMAVGPAGSPDAGTLMVTEDYTAGNRSGRGKVFAAPLVP